MNFVKRALITAIAVVSLSAPAAAMHHSKDIVDTAVAAGTIKTLVAAV